MHIAAFILSLVATVFGIINTCWIWLSQREKLKLVTLDEENLRFSIYNPMARPIQIRTIAYDVHTSKGWCADTCDTRLPQTPFVIEPFTSHEIQLSPGQGFTLDMFQKSRIRLRSSGGKTHTTKL